MDRSESSAVPFSDRSADPKQDYSPLPPPAEPLPRHLAIIMDGNGRWARSRGLLRLRGHERGAESLRRVTRYCARSGISDVTFFALSTENYTRRPRREVNFLMKLLKDYLIGERQELADGNIRLKSIGRTDELPGEVQEVLRVTEAETRGHDGMILRLALNYGSRREIADAASKMARAVQEGRLDAGALDEESIRSFLYDPEMADPDLVVRTAGESRLSNFLLWQASYAEIFVTDVLWPEFDVGDVEQAIHFYVTRRRRFGAVEPYTSTPAAADAARATPGH